MRRPLTSPLGMIVMFCRIMSRIQRALRSDLPQMAVCTECSDTMMMAASTLARITDLPVRRAVLMITKGAISRMPNSRSTSSCWFLQSSPKKWGSSATKKCHAKCS